MFSFSKLKNCPVFLNNQELGEINSLVFDKDEIVVKGFILKKGLLNYSFFEFDQIEKIENEKILIKKESLSKDFSNYEIIGKRVYDNFGNKVGILEDLEFYLHSGKLSSIYVDIDLNIYLKNRFMGKSISKNYVKVQAKNILSFEENKIIIKNTNSIKESKKILENINKFFINIASKSYSFEKNNFNS